MNEFNFQIITPNGIFLEDKIEELHLKTSKGFITILANHIDYIVNVEKSLGFIKKNNIKKYFLFSDGILNINKKKVKLIIDSIISK